jgi:hypothetical protein
VGYLLVRLTHPPSRGGTVEHTPGHTGGRTHLSVRRAGSSAPHSDLEHRRRAVRALAGNYARDADDLVELLAALGLRAEEGAAERSGSR